MQSKNKKPRKNNTKKLCNTFCKNYVSKETKKFEKMIKKLKKTKSIEEQKNLDISLENFKLSGKSLLENCKKNCSVYDGTIIMK